MTLPYGTWPSPLSADRVAAASLRFREIHWDGADLIWLEGRPSERGRQVAVRLRNSTPEDLSPAEINVRSRVHEYGGGALVPWRGNLFYVDDRDGRLYEQSAQGPKALTPAGPYRHGNLVMDPPRQRILAVREDHSFPEPRNEIVAIPWSGGPTKVLLSGADFYSFPRLSPDGRTLAWTSWNHPNMPWDGTELWIASVGNDGVPFGARCIAGGKDISIFQPEWSPAGLLGYVSDESGWWNLNLWNGERSRPLYSMAAEFAEPQWILGQSTYAFVGSDRIIAAATQGATGRLWDIALGSSSARVLPSPYQEFHAVKSNGRSIAFVGSSPDRPAEVVRFEPTSGELTVLRRAGDLPAFSVSAPKPFEFSGWKGRTTYGFYYAPRNLEVSAPLEERPPCLVVSHGGPTGSTSISLDPAVQFWTTRGFAVIDVNYGGSTGYGREYRNRLRSQWGIADVEDCLAAARWLSAQGEIDGDRQLIRGGSAGGYTTLCALAFHDQFRAGTSYYGVSDLENLLKDTHKFESRYLETLLGNLSPHTLRARSPRYHTDGIQVPVLFLQGLEDKVVPPNQSEALYQSLKTRRIPVAYLAFPGEGHGFRKRENLRAALEAELFFYRRILGIRGTENVPAISIDNLD